jgi:hypothetical protein
LFHHGSSLIGAFCKTIERHGARGNR